MKTLSAIKSIKLYCKECSGGSSFEAKNCIISDCILYPYRTGKNPNRKAKNRLDNGNVYLNEFASKSAS